MQFEYYTHICKNWGSKFAELGNSFPDGKHTNTKEHPIFYLKDILLDFCTGIHIRSSSTIDLSDIVHVLHKDRCTSQYASSDLLGRKVHWDIHIDMKINSTFSWMDS